MTGTAIYTYYGVTTPAEQPLNLAEQTVEALVWSGSGWTKYAGTGTTNGSFTIPNVPDGPFMLVVAGEYVYTTARTVDMGYDTGGRPSGVYTTSTTDTIAGALTGLDPWAASDFFQWNAPNAPGAAYDFASTGPSIGATSLEGQVETWSGALIDGTEGDVLYGTQLGQQTAGATTYTSVTRFISFPGIVQTDGTTVKVGGALSVVPQSESVDIDLRSSQFVTLAAGINPQGTPSNVDLSVITAPGAGTVGFVSYDINLLYLYGGAIDTAPGTLAYGNPFPASWGELAYPSITSTVSYTATGATTPATQLGSIFSTTPVANVGSAPIVPVIGPVQAPLVNGNDAFTAQTGVDTIPVLSWTAPAVGTASAYHVTVYEVANDAGTTTLTYQAELATTMTTLRMPPGVLITNHEYMFVITAVSSPLDATTKPFRSSASFASADCLTAIVSP